jgi:hypothetical protein
MTIKIFKIGNIQKLLLDNLLGDSLRGLYAPQVIQKMGVNGKDSIYLGDKILITTKSNKTISLEQFALNDSSLINKSSNLKLQVENGSLTHFQPNFLRQGFYLDFIHSQIDKIEIFAHLSYQLAEDENSEICIKDENDKQHFFIHIECGFILRFHLEKQFFNLMLNNERCFAGGDDFVSRFRILDDESVERLINLKINNSFDNQDNITQYYQKVYSIG